MQELVGEHRREVCEAEQGVVSEDQLEGVEGRFRVDLICDDFLDFYP